MHDRRLGRAWRTGAVLLIVVIRAAGGAAQETASSRPASGTGPSAELSAVTYVDKLHGFTLRPPAESERIKEPGATSLVRWVGRDAKTGAVAWTVGVNTALVKNPDLDLQEYSKDVAEMLRTQEGLEGVATEMTQVDGKGAIDVRGTFGGQGKLWRRQVWVLAQPGRFLIFWVSGPAGQQAWLQGLLQAVLATVKTLDPLEVLRAQEAGLLRGRQFLADLRGRNLVPAGKLQWFAFRQDEKIVGWTLQAEGLAKRGTRAGLEVQTLTMLRLPKDEPRLSRRTLFATADGWEQWRETLQVGEGERKSLVQEEGMRQGDLVVCTLSHDNRLQKIQKPVPFDSNEPREMLLPRCLGLVLPRLIDLSKPASYAFAVYSTADNQFKLRTFTVVGREKITMGGRTIDAVRIGDVEEANEETASDLWVDAQGYPLRLQAPGWPLIEASSREEIVAKMPESARTVEEALKK